MVLARRFGWAGPALAGAPARAESAHARGVPLNVYLPSFFEDRHRHHHGVDTVDGTARPRSAGPCLTLPPGWNSPPRTCAARATDPPACGRGPPPTRTRPISSPPYP